ncbi:hypothetical protein C900_00295 [Fulvivirga imtechensis AK7]|uniref:HTH cro/C1-type domain-containing protein n=1 Tax=Fulvivirga imtechensis AK7 TaxID=1237149 RepID=L8JLZ6_9BACT|nr:helix-turn-helix transcriptional regulator [Fulvivirga imtechensis]ELR68554.1 hypothetical protein C900_00295 [Fulvivirga imtechensis AK7]
MTIKSIFARNFKYFREKARIGQEALAEKIGVNVRTISVYETGKGYPKVDLLVKISQVLQVPVEYFFADDPEAVESGSSISVEEPGVSYKTANEHLNKVKDYRSVLNAYRQLVSDGDIETCEKLLNTCMSIIDDLEVAYLENNQAEAKLKFATDLIRSLAGGKQLF